MHSSFLLHLTFSWLQTIPVSSIDYSLVGLSVLETMREIPPLQTLCLRAVGSFKCSVETTFAKTPEGEPSPASRLLRSFHKRPVVASDEDVKVEEGAPLSIESIPMKRLPCIGPNSSRRMQANDVDLNLPIIAARAPDGSLVMEYGNPALDCLQSIIDSLVELGRMDDSRIKKYFFEEWRCNVLLAAGKPITKKRRRTSTENSNTLANKSTTTALGSLSLYNCSVSHETIDAMLESQMGENLAVLDWTGVHGLHDEMLARLLPKCPNLLRLSLKNCRRLTVESLRCVAQHQPRLESLDVGGAFNISAEDVLEVIPTLTELNEIHVSGLGWTNDTVESLVGYRPWTKVSLAFSFRLTQASLRQSMMHIAETLISVALPFCENTVDNALMGMLGRNLPLVQYLDVRGNPSLTTLTGWYDGRASADLPAQALHVLGRFSGLSEGSVEETKRVQPLEGTLLTVILDASGAGIGITRRLENEAL